MNMKDLDDIFTNSFQENYLKNKAFDVLMTIPEQDLENYIEEFNSLRETDIYGKALKPKEQKPDLFEANSS